VMRFEENEWGVVYKAYRPGSDASTHNYREQWLMMPGITVAGDVNRYAGGATGELPVCGARWSVPIDATHTMHIRAHYLSVRRSRTYDTATRFPVAIAPDQEYRSWSGDGVPELGYTFDGDIAREDATILESMGPLVDRENETLTTAADDGVRALHRREIAAVQAGRDPLGTVRDEEANRLIVLSPVYAPDKPTEPREARAR